MPTTKEESTQESRIDIVEDIAKILNIGRTSAYNLVKEGYFRVVRIGNTLKISQKSFDESLNGMEL